MAARLPGDPTKIRILHGGSREVPHLPPARRRGPVAVQPGERQHLRLQRHRPEEGPGASPRRSGWTRSPSARASRTTSRSRAAPAGCSSRPATSCSTATSPSTTTRGMWSLWRVFDTRQPDLAPLGDRRAVGVAGGLHRPDRREDHQSARRRDAGGDRSPRRTWTTGSARSCRRRAVPSNGEDATVWDWTRSGTGKTPCTWARPSDHTVAHELRRGPSRGTRTC